MYKFTSYFLALAIWVGFGFLNAGFGQSELIVNSDVPREYCFVTESGQRACEAVQSQYTRSVGAPTERCTVSAQGQRTCEWKDAPMQSCLVTSSGRHICEAIKSVESPFSNENMICTETPQGTSCVSRNPPSITSCANVRCTEGNRCIESTTGPQCVPFEEQKLTCANALCSQGLRCIESPTGPQCVADDPPPPTLTCANVLCSQGTKCEETPSGPQCVSNSPNYTPWDRTVCPANYDPVCGQKGNVKRTFGNNCEASRADYAVLYKGECRFTRPQPERPEFCTSLYDPVCAEKQVQCVRAPCPAQRQTFGNECEARKDNFSVVHKGVCRPAPDPERPQMCPMNYDPVCGQKGNQTRTFGNDCGARRDGFRVIYKGRCESRIDTPPPPPPLPSPVSRPEPTMCPMNYDPVCGQKGNQTRSFGNDCEARRDGFRVIYQGRCESRIDTPPPPPPLPSPVPRPEPTMCPMIYQPVCAQKGFDRKTFSNSCVASSKGFKAIYDGQCR